MAITKCCENCHYGKIDEQNMVVTCRRFPPLVTKVEGPMITSHWPLLANWQWCGEWKRQVNRKYQSETD